MFAFALLAALGRVNAPPSAPNQQAHRVTLAAVGDILLHRELQRQAYANPAGFSVIWANLSDLLLAADLTYGNLEVPIAAGVARNERDAPDPGPVFDGKVYTTYPKFNAHPRLAADLAASGFDVVSTANNHALDRGSLGIDRTIAALDAAGLAHVGTRVQGSGSPWAHVHHVRGLKLGFISCTLHTNFGVDHHDQVLDCFDPPHRVADEIRALVQTGSVDAVVVAPHWGGEYTHVPGKRERRFAQTWIDAGALLIVGSHPHVLQPWEWVQRPGTSDALVMYSLGNFVSHQRTLNRCTSVIAFVQLEQTLQGVVIAGVGYVPFYVHHDTAHEAFFAQALARRPAPPAARALVHALLPNVPELPATTPVVFAPRPNRASARAQ